MVSGIIDSLTLQILKNLIARKHAGPFTPKIPRDSNNETHQNHPHVSAALNLCPGITVYIHTNHQQDGQGHVKFETHSQRKGCLQQ